MWGNKTDILIKFAPEHLAVRPNVDVNEFLRTLFQHLICSEEFGEFGGHLLKRLKS